MIDRKQQLVVVVPNWLKCFVSDVTGCKLENRGLFYTLDFLLPQIPLVT